MSDQNVLLIVLDDLPKRTLKSMPFTQAEIRMRGALYPNATITTPLCGPSRSTLLTGKVAHNHGMWANTGEYGGWKVLSQWESEALPVAMNQAGYRTGLFGKYMNGWNRVQIVPPGWDKFAAIIPDDGGDGAYYNYNLVGTAGSEHYGDSTSDYSTDVISDKAAQFIASTEDPFFCYYSPYGAHAEFEPALRHKDSYVFEESDLDPAVNSDNSLRVPWLRDLPEVDIERVKMVYQKQQECVKSVDQGIEQLFAAMGQSRLENTLVIFTGDNGLQRGAQRTNGKNLPYPASTNVPMLARHDGVIEAGSKPDAITTNADITRTILDTAGATIDDVDGLPLGTRPGGVLIEGMADTDERNPGWIGWRSKKWLYVNYGVGQGEELYDLEVDPHCITNVASDKPKTVSELRGRTTNVANPLPPGFSM